MPATDYTRTEIPSDLRDLRGQNVVILVFAMPGCGACEEFLPRFQPKAQAYISAGVPIFFYDLTSEHKSIQSLADRYKVDSAPTTLVLKRGPGSMKISGGIGDEAIDRLLAFVYEVHTGGRSDEPVFVPRQRSRGSQ